MQAYCSCVLPVCRALLRECSNHLLGWCWRNLERSVCWCRCELSMHSHLLW